MRRVFEAFVCVVTGMALTGAAPPAPMPSPAPPSAPVAMPAPTIVQQPPMMWLLNRYQLLASLTAAPGVADPLAPYVAARGEIDYGGKPVPAELLIDGGNAVYVQRMSGAFVGSSAIDTPAKALGLLSDRKMQFLWPALTAWTGADLGLMRARMLANAATLYQDGARNNPRQVSERMAGYQTGATLTYASVLTQTGHRDEAISLVRASFDQMRAQPNYDEFDLSMLGIRLERMLQYHHPEALPAIEAALDAAIPSSSPYYVNVQINRADIRASGGHYAEALALLDSAEQGYHGSKRLNIPGTNSEFDAIRVCTLNGLGNVDEARALFATLPKARDFTLPFNESATTIRLRTLICMRDTAGVAGMMQDDLADSKHISLLVLSLQPIEASTNANARFVNDALRADPAIAAAFAQHQRVLPPSLAAALNW